MFTEIEKNIGYNFNNKALLKNALTHSSYSHELMIGKERGVDNERLEFLGDAVLELLSSEFLYEKYPALPEGKLSKLRASMVCEAPLAACARKIKIDEYILLGKGEKLNHGEKRDSILSDAFEAVIGAIYLDGGLEPARKFVVDNVMVNAENTKLFHDSKTELQMIVQGIWQTVPVYDVISEEGPPHDRTYTVSCKINGTEYGTGKGTSKKNAQQEAAKEAMERLEREGVHLEE